MNNKIDEISLNVKNFLNRSSESEKKIMEIEGKINKMQNYFSKSAIVDSVNIETKTAFDAFIRKGDESGLVTKSLSGESDNAGVLITPTLSNKIISAINANSPMRQLASVESISTRSLDLVVEDGAFASGWVSEAGAREVTANSQLLKKTIYAHEIYAQPKATQSIIDDSEINIENWLVNKLTDSFVKLENEAFISGDGVNKPFGLLTNKNVSRVNVGAKIDPNMLLNLINQLEEGYLSNASFLMNRKTLSAIQGLKDSTGRFIWQQSLSDPLKQTIFGVPVVISSNMPDIAKDSIAVAIGDFKSAYKIIDRSNINLVRDPYTDKPYIKFYAVKRVGGDVINPAAIKFAKFSA